MKKRVLVVDDDVAVREAMQRVLVTAGYEVRLARSGEEAATRFPPEQTDLLLVDLNLPSPQGWEVFERLTTRYPLVPVIIMTGMPNQSPTAAAAGASALMEKPIEPAALLHTISEVLAQQTEARVSRMASRVEKRSRGQQPGRLDRLHRLD